MTPTIPLGEAFEFIRNGMSVKQNKDAGGLPITRIETISDGTVDLKRVGYAGLAEEEVQKWLLQPGDLLLSHINSVEHIGKCALFEGADIPLVHGMNLLGMRPKHEILFSRYAMWAMKEPGFKRRILRFVNKAVNQASISTTNLKTIEIPLPPLEEQKRIAQILDQADTLRRLRTRALDKLNTLGQAIFHEMFGDVARNPMGWPIGCIGDLLDEAKYGSSAKANTEGKGLPMLRMGNLTYDGQIDLTSLKHVELSLAEFQKYTTQKGDLLFNRTNSKELVGKTAVVKQEEPLAFAGYLVRGRANKLGNTDYISAYLNSAHGKSTLVSMCKNIVGMANINAKELQKIRIAMPPKELQDQFSEAIDAITPERDKLLEAIEIQQSLFASLQHRAFRGEL